MLREILFIARKDLQYLLMRRETLVWTFVMPVLFFYFIGAVTGGSSAPGAVTRDRLGLLAPADAGFLGEQVARRLQRDFDVVRVSTAEELAKFDRRVVLPEGFAASVMAPRPTSVRFTRTGGGPGAALDEVRIKRALYTVLADVALSTHATGAVTAESFARLDALPRNVKLESMAAGHRRVVPSGFEQSVPGITVMFTLLVLLTTSAVLLVNERREGLLRRLAMTPISRTALVAGKWTGRMALGTVQLAFALAAGTVLFKMRWGPDFPMVLLVLLVYAGLNASLGLLLGSLARSDGQAVGIGVLTTNLLAALGGCWWPIEVTPSWMQKVALALPTGWAMDALHRLISFQSGPSSVVPHLVALSLGMLAAGWGAVRFFRYE